MGRRSSGNWGANRGVVEFYFNDLARDNYLYIGDIMETTIEDLGLEIEGYLNANTNDLSYKFLHASEKDEGTGINEVTFSAAHVNREDQIIIELSLPQEGGSRFRGHVFHLKLKEDPTKLNGTVTGWIKQDIDRAEQELMKH